MDAIVDALGDDSELAAANTRRRLQLIDRQQKSDQKKLRRRFAQLVEKFRPGDEPGAKRTGSSANGSAASGGQRADTDGAAPEFAALPTLEHPTFVKIVRTDEPLVLRRGRRTAILLESDAPDAYLATHANARLVLVDPAITQVTFVRASDFRGGRARMWVRTTSPAGTAGNATARLTDAAGDVLADSAPYVVADPPPAEPATNDGSARLRVPEIYEVYAAEWTKFGFSDASVGAASESLDDYSIFVNMDNRHLRRLLESSGYVEAGFARMKSSYLVQTAFYTFLLHKARALDGTIDDLALETYQQRKLDRVAQTVVTAIASVERIDSAALFDPE